MAETIYPAGERPAIRVRGFERIPCYLTKINSKTAYFRSPYLAGEIATDVDRITMLADQPIVMKIEREVTPQEIFDLVWGTGALTWEWWRGAVPLRNGCILKDWPTESDPLQPGDEIQFRIDDPDAAEGSGSTRTVTLSLADVVATVGKAQQYIDPYTWKNMTSESIGYADAADADIILQIAVLGEITYG